MWQRFFEVLVLVRHVPVCILSDILSVDLRLAQKRSYLAVIAC